MKTKTYINVVVFVVVTIKKMSMSRNVAFFIHPLLGGNFNPKNIVEEFFLTFCSSE